MQSPAETPEHHIHHTLENMQTLAKERKHQPASMEMLHDFAFLLSKFAEISTRDAKELGKQTHALIILTRWLVALTVALLLFTAYLTYDAARPNASDNNTNLGQQSPAAPNP